MQEHQKETSDKGHDTGHKGYDIKVWKLSLIGLVGIMLLVAALYFIDQFFRARAESQMKEVVMGTPSDSLEQLRAHEDSMLSQYLLIDTTAGIYQIPIKRAMEIIAREDSTAKGRSGGEH